MADDNEIALLRDELREARRENKEQFGFGRDKFNRLEQTMEDFREVIKQHSDVFHSMNEGVLDGVNERAAYVDTLMERSKFWSDLRDELTRKSVMVACLCLMAGIVFWLGFEDIARKMIGF